MTDGAGLPMALSDLVATLCAKRLVDATVTCGHAFGGDYEAVSIYSALAVARHVARADAAVVVMGPGIVGTNTRLGFSGMEVGPILDAAHAFGGVAIACLRVSFADGRDRHVGLSHHSATALRLATRERVLVAVPELPAEQAVRLRDDLVAAGIDRRHELVDVDAPDVLELLRPARPARSRRWAGPRPTTPRCSRPRRPRGRRSRPSGSTVADRLERLVNLTATLLDTRRPLTLDELSERVEPRYPEEQDLPPPAVRARQGDAARARRARSRVETVDGFGAEQAYRIHPDDYYLPELSLTEPELAALHVAVTAVRLEGDAGREGLAKLGGLAGEGADSRPRRARREPRPRGAVRRGEPAGAR